MFTLPDKQVVLAELNEFKLSEIQPTADGSLGLYQRDNIADFIEADIDAWSYQMLGHEKPRHHLGASVVGHYCDRYIWNHFRWTFIEKPKPRMLRLFWRGHREEEIIITMLRGIGFTVIDVDPLEQIRIPRDDAEGHFGGSLDAICYLPTRYGLPPFPILLEIKTANTKYFKDIKNLGVLKARERYYKQMCVYGLKRKLDYALFICSNKNDDDLDIEFLALDHGVGEDEIRKAEVITQMYHPPKKLSNDASYWECKICPMYQLCHGQLQVERNCRSCRFAQPVAGGQWHCHNYNQIIPPEFLIQGCQAWESLPQ